MRDEPETSLSVVVLEALDNAWQGLAERVKVIHHAAEIALLRDLYPRLA